MSKVVKAEELTDILQEYLENYKEDIEEDVEECTHTVISQAKSELKGISPISSKDVVLKGGEIHTRGSYSRGWATKTPQKGKGKYVQVIWNKTDYRLTHLLEFGHFSRNGTTWVEPSPEAGHIRPVEKKYLVKFIDLMEDKIRRN